MKTVKREPKGQKPRRIAPEPKVSTLADVTPPEDFIIAICDSASACNLTPKEKALAAAMKRAEKGKRILECGNLFLEHLENFTLAKPEKPDIELRLIEAILDYPAAKLASGLASCSIHALALQTIAMASPYESVKKEAQEKIKKAKALSGSHL